MDNPVVGRTHASTTGDLAFYIMNLKSTTCCAYCGNATTDMTRDHVVPSALWLRGKRPKHPAVVPACPTCHKAYDREAAYFRNCLVAMCDTDAHPMLANLLSGPVVRSITRRPVVAHDFFRNATLRERRSREGIINGAGWTFDIDMARFNRTVEKIVRGLFYWRSTEHLPDTHKVDVFAGNGFWQTPDFRSLLPKLEPEKGFGDDVFTCRSQRDADDPNSTAWLLIFYQQVGVFACSHARS